MAGWDADDTNRPASRACDTAWGEVVGAGDANGSVTWTAWVYKLTHKIAGVSKKANHENANMHQHRINRHHMCLNKHMGCLNRHLGV